MSKEVIASIKAAFAKAGRRAAFCPLEALADICDYRDRLNTNGSLSKTLVERYLSDFVYTPPEKLKAARSVVVVASPIGRTIIELDLERGRIEAVVPPTYGVAPLVAENAAILATALASVDSGYERARLPLKSLAARTGLARYGRDNVLRFEGWGSYVRLDAWWTGIDAEGEPWGEELPLERCSNCQACVRACPNGCLANDRFLIDASRCLTFMNERPEPFPTWLDSKAHNAAVGCMRCQEACPENARAPGKAVCRRIALSRRETMALLAGEAPADSAAIEAALVASDFVGDAPTLGRNLRALIAARA